ncbi:MAG: proline dehydrogenase family protein [Ignavibacteria bacterium]
MNPLNTALVQFIQILPRKIVRIFANRYIAGDKLQDAIDKVIYLNNRNIMATMDVLGESIKDRNEAIASKDESLKVLEAIDKHKLNSNLSIKLTMLGLNLNYDFCLSLVREIVSHAKSLNNFVRIDMEDSSVTDATINIYRDIREEFDNVGIVIQAYLRRSEEDIRKLTDEGANIRLCKGIYVEPESIAFKKKAEIRENFLRLLRIIFEKRTYVGIATHDDYLITQAYKMIKDYNLSQQEYEFQMLLGVRENLRDKIVTDGHRMRIYTPFGNRWYQYSIRRFKENPNVAGQILKSILTGGR